MRRLRSVLIANPNGMERRKQASVFFVGVNRKNGLGPGKLDDGTIAGTPFSEVAANQMAWSATGIRFLCWRQQKTD
jgi:hypothetical protein